MSPTRLARVESAVRVVLAFAEAYNRHDLEGMMQLVADDCVFGSASPAPDGSTLAGKEALSRYWQDFFRESPQARIEIEDVFGIGLRCVLLRRHEWTDAAGRRQHLRGVDLFQVRNGLISEQQAYVKA